MEYTYAQYQRHFASYGFTDTPLSESEFSLIMQAGLGHELYGIGCDMANDMFESVEQAIAWHLEH